MTSPGVWVRAEDVETATAVVARYASGEGAATVGEPWICPKCSEAIEGQFTDCWNCGATRPGAEGETES